MDEKEIRAIVESIVRENEWLTHTENGWDVIEKMAEKIIRHRMEI